MKLKTLFLIFICFWETVILQAQVTLKDLEKMQNDMDVFSYRYRTGRCIIYDKNMVDVPGLEVRAFNTDKEDKNVCIVTYASLNPPYNRFLDKLIDSLYSNFKGHLLYRKGGWPNLSGGCCDHAFSAYGFKVCAIQEAYNLGYKKVLWLDSIVEAINDLSPLFDHLEDSPCVYRYSKYPFFEHVTSDLIQKFQLKEDEMSSCSHVAAGVLGFNFINPLCVNVLKEWHECSKERLLWSATFPEQMILSVIISRLGLDELGLDNLVHFGDDYSRNHFFRINYDRKIRN